MQAFITSACICNVHAVVMDTRYEELSPKAICVFVFHSHYSFLCPMVSSCHTPSLTYPPYPAPVVPSWSPLCWHIKATLLSQQPKTPLIHQATWVSLVPSLSNSCTAHPNSKNGGIGGKVVVWEYVEKIVFQSEGVKQLKKEDRWSERGVTVYENYFFLVAGPSVCESH